MKMISVPFFIRRSVYHPRQRISYPQGISSVTDAPRGSRNEFDEFRGMGRERISLNPRLAFASRGFRIAADDRARRAPLGALPVHSRPDTAIRRLDRMGASSLFAQAQTRPVRAGSGADDRLDARAKRALPVHSRPDTAICRLDRMGASSLFAQAQTRPVRAGSGAIEKRGHGLRRAHAFQWCR